MGLNCYFYYSGIMTLPINVNENSLIMLNYQYIFYGIGSYATLNLRNIVEEKSEKRRSVRKTHISHIFYEYSTHFFCTLTP